MTNEISFLISPLLTEYFLIDSICNVFISEKTRTELFKELAQIFCVPLNSETETYYAVANSSQFKKITDYASYERLCRTIEYAENSGVQVELTQVDRVILAQKREALLIKSKILDQNKNLTKENIGEILFKKATNGNVDAMAVLSYMEYHGICVCKDQKNAIRRFSTCAKWNNLFGNLMGIAYDKKNQTKYYDTLYSILKGSNQKLVFKHICIFNSYERVCERHPVARIIEKAFGLDIIERNTYDRIFSKVAFSELISTEDKEKLLLSKKRDAIFSLSDIPFDVFRSREFSFDVEKAEKTPLVRKEEIHNILCSIYPAVNNCASLYHTLLVAGEDEYVHEMYVEAVKTGFSGNNKVFEVDAGTLTAQDFAGSKENFILRGLSETKQSNTVFLVKHCEEIGDNEMDELIKLLDYEYRLKFKMLEPTVSLDLSDIMIILFASEINGKVRTLARECDVVWTKKISGDEKQTMINTMFRSRSKSFGIGQATLDDEGMKYLISFRTGQIIRILDGALKKAAFDKEEVVTAESLRTITSQQNMSVNRREFGYTGGAFNEKY